MNYPPLVQIIGAWIETVILGRQLAYKALHPLAPSLTFRKSLRSTDRQTCLTEGQGSYTVKISSSSLLLSLPPLHYAPVFPPHISMQENMNYIH